MARETKVRRCVVMFCACEHAGQDKMYGLHMRVHNPAPKAGKEPTRVRCTVCGRERNT